MYRFKQSLVAFFGLLALAGLVALVSPLTGRGQKPSPVPPAHSVTVDNSEANPVPITGAVSVLNSVPTYPGVPPGAFSVSINTLGGGQTGTPPDAEGTSYAVTSFTVTNNNLSTPISASIVALWGTTSNCSSFSGGIPNTQPGPRVRVPAGETLHLTFPQPVVLSAQPGATSCLRVLTGGVPIDGSASIYLVGYRLPPAAPPQQ